MREGEIIKLMTSKTEDIEKSSFPHGPQPITSDSDNIKKPISYEIPGLSPYRLLPLMVVSIFCSEIVIMFILDWLPEFHPVTEAIVDSTMLLVILSPTFYLLHYRPLLTHHHERKKIADRLQHSEERLKLALDAVNDGLWDWDFKTDTIYFSPRWLGILGYHPGELDPHFRSWEELIHPADYQKTVSKLKRHLDGEIELFNSEFRMKSATGDWRWVLARGKVVSRDKNGEPLRAVGTHTDIHTQKIAEKEAQQQKKNIQHLSQQLIRNSESEKKRLAQDLHDEFGQLLTAFKLGIELIQHHQLDSKQELEFQCARLLGTIDYMEDELKMICDNLRPVILDDLGLAATLMWLAQQIEKQSDNLRISVDTTELETRLSSETEIVCYRICQEALNNSLKHAAASEVNIHVRAGDRTIIVRISDNGCGFDKGHVDIRDREHWGIGLLGMHERAAAINGHVNIISNPGKGTTVELVVPLRKDGEEERWPLSASQ